LIGVLVATPASLNFGDVAVGFQTMQTLSVENTGAAMVNLSKVTVTDAGFSALGSLISPFSVPVGQSFTIQLEFTPQSAAAVTGSLLLMSDASNSPLTMTLDGTGAQSDAAATQAEQ
jgi:hypothetical protein